ncbi:MAG: TssQ family T6SS-associated lipoprotein [Burkholderiales bacterium]|nr:MAG: TssQ family T6SS-associated lipoprotein [Burkholderiales bacterium]
MGATLYDRGDFERAIRSLGSAEPIWQSNEPLVKIAAHKLMAFSACALGRRQACRDAFDALLKIDPGFELTPAEAGHPIWGPIFVEAKQAARTGTGR